MSDNQLQRVQWLSVQFEGLRTFNDVAQSDAAALDTALNLQKQAEHTRLHQQGLRAQADDFARAHATRPFFKRMLSSRAPERMLRAQAEQLSATVQQLGEMINDLLERIDYTPDDEKERKALLKELRAEKKELQVQKREIAAQKREINHAARSASAGAGRQFFGLIYDSTMAAAERRAIRRQKIAELAPYENAKMAVERQILDLDRRIAWVERFGKGED